VVLRLTSIPLQVQYTRYSAAARAVMRSKRYSRVVWPVYDSWEKCELLTVRRMGCDSTMKHDDEAGFVDSTQHFGFPLTVFCAWFFIGQFYLPGVPSLAVDSAQRMLTFIFAAAVGWKLLSLLLGVFFLRSKPNRHALVHKDHSRCCEFSK